MDRSTFHEEVFLRVFLVCCFFIAVIQNVLAEASIVTLSEVIRNWESLQVVDARSLDEFRKDHLPGAIHMDWRKFRQVPLSISEQILGPDDGQVLSDAKRLEETLSNLGIREDLPILVYGGKSRWGEEGRIAWNLLYWGAKDVRLLNGGWETWNTVRPRPKRKTHPAKRFSVKLVSERRTDFAGVQHFLAMKKRIIDVRSLSEFRAGKIPTASHFPDERLYKRNGSYPDRNELLAVLPELSSADVFYCAGGVRSALAAILVEARFGTIMRNYDGSMWDWKKKSTR